MFPRKLTIWNKLLKIFFYFFKIHEKLIEKWIIDLNVREMKAKTSNPSRNFSIGLQVKGALRIQVKDYMLKGF